MRNESLRWAGSVDAMRAVLRQFKPETKLELKSICKALVALEDYGKDEMVCVEIVHRGTKREHVVVGLVIFCVLKDGFLRVQAGVDQQRVIPIPEAAPRE